MRLFVKSIGKVELQEKGKRDVLVVLLTDNDVNLGVIFLQLSNFALKIKKQIEEDRLAQRTMKMSENEIKEHIKELKKEIFSDRLGTIS
jgi:hypothetical protein